MREGEASQGVKRDNVAEDKGEKTIERDNCALAFCNYNHPEHLSRAFTCRITLPFVLEAKESLELSLCSLPLSHSPLSPSSCHPMTLKLFLPWALWNNNSLYAFSLTIYLILLPSPSIGTSPKGKAKPIPPPHIFLWVSGVFSTLFLNLLCHTPLHPAHGKCFGTP